MTELIKNFKNINKNDVAIAGGKGASLGEMTQTGIPVPEGFVILSSVFDRFIKEKDLNFVIDSLLDEVNIKEVNAIENASEKIQAMILLEEIPEDIKTEILNSYRNLGCKFVAVRSSATSEDSASAAWAGQLESYLNTTEETLLENVKKCWASLFTSRAIFYRLEKNLKKDKISVAVVVQKMVESEKSGVAFSVHPVTQNINQLIIEAGFGLGEAIVSGQITPDSYVVSKTLKKIIDKNVYTQTKGLYRAKDGGNKWRTISKAYGKKQVLSDEEILRLTEIILRIENHYNFPCDIEWVLENEKFYIVQSRLITTLSKLNNKYPKEDWFVVVSFKTELLTEAITHRGFRESLPKLLPQIPKFRNRMIIDNDVYLDLNETSKIQDYFSTDIINRAEEVYKKIEKQSEKFLKTAKAVVVNSEKLSGRKLSEKIRRFFIEYQKTIGVIGVPMIIDLAIEEKLKDILQRSGILNIENLLSSLAIPYKQVETSKEKDDLLSIADEIRDKGLDLESEKIAKLIDEHQENYGWIHSTLFLGNIYTKEEIKMDLQEILNQPVKQKDYPRQEREEYFTKAKKIIEKITSPEGKVLAEFFQKSVYYRTARLEWMNRACFVGRPLIEECAKRLNITFNELIYLLPNEIITAVDNGKISADQVSWIKERQKGYAYISNNSQEYLLATGYNLDTWKSKFSKEHEDSSKIIKGVIAFKGVSRGKVIIVKDRNELHLVEDGDILVTRLTTPDFVVAMKKAAAIVTDLGGITSHAAVTSRELKIPCIVGTKNATKILKKGKMVKVDANKGIIKIL